VRLGAVLAAIALAATPAACGGDADDDNPDYASQSSIKPLAGNPGHHVVTLTQTGADQVGIKTQPVTGTSELSVLPYASLLYDSDGTTFVYVSPKPLTFTYQRINLVKIVGERIYFTAGPKVGTQVVTSGVPQVHGADIQLEFGEIA